MGNLRRRNFNSYKVTLGAIRQRIDTSVDRDHSDRDIIKTITDILDVYKKNLTIQDFMVGQDVEYSSKIIDREPYMRRFDVRIKVTRVSEITIFSIAVPSSIVPWFNGGGQYE